MKAVTETIDTKADKDTIKELESKLSEQQRNQTSRMKELEIRFRKDMDEKIKKLEMEIKGKEVFPALNIQPAGTINLGPSTPTENLSIQQEIQHAQRNYAAHTSSQQEQRNTQHVSSLKEPIPKQRTIVNPQRPGKAPTQSHKYGPIVTNSKEDIIKEAATNVGITKVSDLTIRKFSNLKDKMRYPKETVWTGPEFFGARNLFVRYYLVKKMKFLESEIRFSDVRFCRELEKGILWIRSDRGFVKSMKIRAAELQDNTISLINFTPNRAYKRYMALKEICDQIRLPDPENIKTQIRPGKSDFEVWIKVIKPGSISKYEKHSVQELDPRSELPELEVEVMKTDEVLGYMNAANQAIEDARNDDARNRDENNLSDDVIDVSDVPFITIERRSKRKASDDIERDERENRTMTPESVRNAVNKIHTSIGYTVRPGEQAENDSETDISVD